MSGGQFTFDLTKPTDNSQESVFPALDRADKTALVSVLGTLLPSSTASTSKRQTQIADVYYEAFNAVYASASGNWGSENSAIDAYGLRFNNAVDLIEVVYHPSTTTSWSSAQWVGGKITMNPATGAFAATSLQVGGTPVATPTMVLKTGSGGGDYSNTNTTYADLDGTNLAYTVTIPTVWKMLINCALAGTSTGGNGTVALTDGTTLLAESLDGLGLSNGGVALTYTFPGDGASHTFKLRVFTASGTWTIRNGSATNTPMMTFFLTPSS